MAIAKMDRLTLVGLAGEREAVVEALLRLGAVHIDVDAAAEQAPANPAVQAAYEPAGLPVRVEELPSLMTRLQQVITASAKLRPIKKPPLASKREVSADQFKDTVARRDEIMAYTARFEEAKNRINEIDSQIVRLQNTEAMLLPWAAVKIDLAHMRTQKTRSWLGSFRTRAELQKLDEALADEAPESITHVLSEGEDGLHVHVVTLQIRENLVLANLRRLNFSFLPVQEKSTTPAELLDRIQTELTGLTEERGLLVAVIDEIAGHLVDFEIFHDYLKMQFDRFDLLRRLAGTNQTFYLEGWIPSRLTDSVTQALAGQFTVAFDKRAPLADEQFPILLQNRKLLKPYEVVVEMFNPPLPSELDPTPVLAPFYFLFFGMMLSDVGYGLIMSLFCALAIFKLKVKGALRQTLMLFFQCGLSAIFWGIMFGGYFGDMIATLTGGRFAIPPALFDPLKNPTTLMLLSVILGIVHLFTGMGVKAYMLICSGNWQGAVFEVFPWYCIILGLVLTLAGIGTPWTGYLALAGALLIVLFSARQTRNPFSRIGQGLYTLYGITSYLGDILSYTRILALVLATSVIAMVVNKIGFLFGPTPLGFIVFIVAALIGHSVNFALSALSAYIHTIRLHFVEFFGKFYEGGGIQWKPQKLTARYIEITRAPQAPALKPNQLNLVKPLT